MQAVKIRHHKGYSGIWVVLTLVLALSTALFAAIALRNARTLDCHSFETDKKGNSFCRIWIGWEPGE